MGESSRGSMEGPRRKPRRVTVHREVWKVQKNRSNRNDTSMGKTSAKKEGGRGKFSKDIRGIKTRDRKATYLHGPIDYAKMLKLRFV